MKCNICDRQLKDDEIKLDPEYGTFDPCGVCLDVIGDVFGDLTEEEITSSLHEELPDVFEDENTS